MGAAVVKSGSDDGLVGAGELADAGGVEAEAEVVGGAGVEVVEQGGDGPAALEELALGAGHDAAAE